MEKIKYSSVRKAPSFGNSGEGLWYAKWLQRDVMSAKELENEICRGLNVSSSAATTMLTNLRCVLQTELARGRAVELGDIGVFRLEVASRGHNSPKVPREKIKKVALKFSAKAKFNDYMDCMPVEYGGDV